MKPVLPNRSDTDSSVETRNFILQTARRLFLELGFRAVSTRHIAASCGLTQPALYHHFASKQDLYLAVHQDMLAETKIGLDRIIRRREPLQDSLTAVIRYMTAVQSQDTNLLFHDLEHEVDVEIRNTIRTLFRENVVAPITVIFVEAVQQGVLLDAAEGGVSPTFATYLLLSMVRGTAHTSEQQGEAVYRMDKGAEQIVNILLNGLPRP